ncbi:MAG: hypothetical protein ACQESA_01560 [Patescibacteria group bacterium]
MSPLTKLSEILATFPGIGPRHAERLAYFLSSKDRNYISSLQKALEEISVEGKRCTECRSLFYSKGNESVCSLCSDSKRDPAYLIVTDTEINRNSIEKSEVTDGFYFILGKVLPVTERSTSKLPIDDLNNRIRDLSGKGLKEVMIVLSYTPEGEHTGNIVKDSIKKVCEEKGVVVSFPGRGFSVGTEIEYSDADTLKQAFKNRGTPY